MRFLEAILLSIVQGVSEWLPISSSGHLVLFEKWLQISGADLAFDVFLHVASLLVILLFFRKQIIEICKAPFVKTDNQYKNWWWYIVLSSIFTAVIAYFLYYRIDNFRTIDSVANWFLITSILLLATKFSQGDKTINWWQAIILGIVQGVAVLPGLSRSGAVIAIALLMKIKKDQAFSYGFIAAIPAIFGSFLLTAKDTYNMFLSVGSDAAFGFNVIYILAFVFTAVVSYLSLYLLKIILRRDYFYLFSVYTFILFLILKLI